ncbi:MAG: serine/threonine-protein phosphatase [Deltaproteobacteria bacterium]|nr:MAG: serine/threonine-protein phosphatase [Deltaproteobacteria bacterium]
MKFLTSILSKAGGRKENQDHCDYLVSDHGACWVLADGLGGHRGGEVASRLAVENTLGSFRPEPEISSAALKKHIQTAQDAIIHHQEEDPRLFFMRTTVVILITDFQSVLWAHIGDSRLCHFRSGRIIFQTEDHSVPQAMANAGDITPEEIRFHEDRNRLLRTLGKEDDLRPVIREEPSPLQNSDTFLLCTDGFWEYVTETEMEVDLAKSYNPQEWLEKMETRILERARKDHDNYSAIGISVSAPE